MNATQILSPLDAAVLRYAEAAAAVRQPIPVVLDTCCVRSGLDRQLKSGREPASIAAALRNNVRLFMELDTLHETVHLLPEFAEQLGVALAQLREMFTGWLPLIRVVALPPSLRELDPRALAVQALDSDDYPGAALMALLSPCIGLTTNVKDFGPLGVASLSQGTTAVAAVIHVAHGELEVEALMLLPAAPVALVASTAKWAIESHGLFGLLGLIVVTAGGAALYRRQSPATKERLKQTAIDVGQQWLEEGAVRIAALNQARNEVVAGVVPAPSTRSWQSAVLRQLAVSDESLSAQQLHDVLDPSPSVVALRRFLHNNKPGLFNEVRPGSFGLGRQFTLR